MIMLLKMKDRYFKSILVDYDSWCKNFVLINAFDLLSAVKSTTPRILVDPGANRPRDEESSTWNAEV